MDTYKYYITQSLKDSVLRITPLNKSEVFLTIESGRTAYKINLHTFGGNVAVCKMCLSGDEWKLDLKGQPSITCIFLFRAWSRET